MSLQPSPNVLAAAIVPSAPLMTREAFAVAVGLPVKVVVSQCDKGYWPCVRVGKYSLINVEGLRAKLLERAQEFVL